MQKPEISYICKRVLKAQKQDIGYKSNFIPERLNAKNQNGLRLNYNMNHSQKNNASGFRLFNFNSFLIGSLLVFVLLISYNFYSIFQRSKKLNSDIDHYKIESLQKQQVLSDALNINSRIKSILFLHLLSDYPKQMAAYRKEFDTLALQHDQCLSTLDSLFHEKSELDMLKNLRKFSSRLFIQRNYFLKLSENNKNEGKNYYSRSLYYAYSLYTVQLQNMADYADRTAIKYYDTIQERINRNYMNARTTGIIGMLFIVFLVLVVMKVTGKIKKDNTTLQGLLLTKEKAEAEIKKLNEELEAKVIERTKQLNLTYAELQQQIDALNVSACVTETDPAGKITSVNDNFCKISGYTRDELIGNTHRLINSGYHGTGFFKILYETVLSGNVWKADVKNKAKNGNYFWLDTTIVPFINENGEITKLLAIRFDITRQKEQQSKLQEQADELSAQSEELRVQQEELHEANIVLSAQTKKLIASEEELKMQQEELLQSNQELEEKSQMLTEKNVLINDKNTALETAAAELQKKATELALSSKYKSEFLANMSHELRTPLNSILLLSKLLADNNDGNLTEDQIEYAGVINSSGSGLLELINEILDLSKIEAGKMDVHKEHIPISHFCKSAENIFKPLAKNKGITFSVSLGENVPESIFTDRIRIEQVIKNLCSNAVKFTETGGVKMNVYTPLPETINNLKLWPGNYIAFEVIDSGIGIAADKLEHVFEAFQQADGSTRRKYGGTGLGLSISREIAHLLKGEIRLTSEPGKGSNFTLIVPTQEINEPPALKQNESVIFESDNKQTEQIKETPAATKTDDKNKIKHMYRPDKALSGKNILIVDDDNRNIFSLKTILEKNEVKVTTAGNGKEALAVMNNHPELDLVLMDMMMPEMDGYETVRELRKNKNWENLPVIALTAKVMKGDREKCMEAGVSDYLTKPIAGEQLISLIKVWLYK